MHIGSRCALLLVSHLPGETGVVSLPESTFTCYFVDSWHFVLSYVLMYLAGGNVLSLKSFFSFYSGPSLMKVLRILKSLW